MVMSDKREKYISLRHPRACAEDPRQPEGVSREQKA